MVLRIFIPHPARAQLILRRALFGLLADRRELGALREEAVRVGRVQPRPGAGAPGSTHGAGDDAWGVLIPCGEACGCGPSREGPG